MLCGAAAAAAAVVVGSVWYWMSGSAVATGAARTTVVIVPVSKRTEAVKKAVCVLIVSSIGVLLERNLTEIGAECCAWLAGWLGGFFCF